MRAGLADENAERAAVSECIWEPCAQEPFGGELCYFHKKRLEGLIAGIIPGPGLTAYAAPPARVRALLQETQEQATDD